MKQFDLCFFLLSFLISVVLYDVDEFVFFMNFLVKKTAHKAFAEFQLKIHWMCDPVRPVYVKSLSCIFILFFPVIAFDFL